MTYSVEKCLGPALHLLFPRANPTSPRLDVALLPPSSAYREVDASIWWEARYAETPKGGESKRLSLEAPRSSLEVPATSTSTSSMIAS